MTHQKTIMAATAAMPPNFLKKIGATNVTVASQRSIRFDIPMTSAGVNRVKLTLQENGEWRMRTYKVEELEDVPNIEPGSLVGAIKTLAMVEQ